MGKEMRILIVEDSAVDAELIARELVKEGLANTSKLVQSKDKFLKALGEFAPDVILCDYKMPSFSAPEALEIVKKSYPQTPLIVVSGTIGEDVAIDAIKLGAVDYIMKDRLGRLVPAVRRAIEEARMASDRKQAEINVQKQKDRAQKYLDVAGVMLLVIDQNGNVSLINKKGCEILGYAENEIIGKNWFDNFIPERIREQVKAVDKKIHAGQAEELEYYENPVLTKSGQERLIAWHNTILCDEDRKTIWSLCSGDDITERKKTEEKLKETMKIKS